MRHKVLIPVVMLLFFPGLIAFSQGQNKKAVKDSLNYGHERLSFTAGAFLTSISNNISIGSSQLGLGININVEDALGLNTSMFVFRGETEYTFGKRMHSSVSLGTFSLNRKANKVLESNIEIGDQVFPIGTSVSSKFNTVIIRGNYIYSFFMDDRFRLSASVGFYVMSTKFSVKALNSFGEAGSLIAPLPVLGTQSSFWITPKFIIKQSIEVLYLKVATYKGSITDINIRVEYLPFKHIGIGMGYNAFRFNLYAYEGNKFGGEFIGNLEITYSGLFAYGKLYF